MSYIKRIVFLILYSNAHALGFGSMGNLSPSMGGAGVALRSPFSLYYNPALLSSQSTTSFGYSVGVGVVDNNILRLIDADLDNIQSSLTQLSDQFSSIANGVPGVPGVGVPAAAAAVAAVAGASSNPPSSLVDVLKKSLEKVNGSSSSSGGGGGGSSSSMNGNDNLQTLIKTFKESPKTNDEIAQVFKSEVGNSSLSQSQKDLLTSIAGSIDFKNLASDGSGSVSISQITIKREGNENLDKAVDDIGFLRKALDSGSIDINTQAGLALTFGSGAIRGLVGALGVGIFVNNNNYLSVQSNPDASRLIVGEANKGYELVINEDSYTFKTTDDTDKGIIKSIQNGSVSLLGSTFVLMEVPIGYAYTFYLPGSNLNVGMAIKRMTAFGMYKELKIDSNILSDLVGSLGNMGFDQNVGVDLGVLYEIDSPTFTGLGFGLVAKNVNKPVFRLGDLNARVDPQVRTGIAYNGDMYSAAFDIDVTKNNVSPFLNAKEVYSQMIGAGVRVGSKAFDVRAGVAYDLEQKYGLILTAGTSLFRVIDASIEVGTDFHKLSRLPISFPSRLAFRVGGSFSF